jgi:hypothetical protein
MEESSLVDDTPKEENTKCISRTVIIFAILAAIAGLLVVYFVNPSKNDSTLKFIFINDIHYDPDYKSKGSPSNNKCRIETNTSAVPHPYGQYGCDTPKSTLASMLSHAKSVLNEPSFVVIGGDVLPSGHGLTRDAANKVHAEVYNMVKDTFKDSDVFMVVGHTDLLNDYGDFGTDSADFAAIDKVYSAALSDKERETFKSGGYYYRDFPDHKVRILFLNTIVYSSERVFDDSRADPYNQFAFMTSASKEAEDEGYGVGAIIHLPPTVSSSTNLTNAFHDFYAEKFNRVVKEAGIRFILTGHTHYDTFLPLYKNGESNLHILSAPSVSPSKGNNPAFRIVKIRTGEIEDYNQYFADLTSNPQELKWEEEYSFTNAYDTDDVSPNSVQKAITCSQSSSTGRWRYRERLFARADQLSPFYYCLLNNYNKTEMEECMSGYSKKTITQSYISDEI